MVSRNSRRKLTTDETSKDKRPCNRNCWIYQIICCLLRLGFYLAKSYWLHQKVKLHQVPAYYAKLGNTWNGILWSLYISLLYAHIYVFALKTGEIPTRVISNALAIAEEVAAYNYSFKEIVTYCTIVQWIEILIIWTTVLCLCTDVYV